MLERVLLPAPFSPRSACTSPAAASKSTPSFARTPGKRFVIPRIATAGGGGARSAPLRSSSINSWLLGGFGEMFFAARAVLHGPCGTRSFRQPLLALRAADHALHEPVHLVEVLDAQLLALRDSQLSLLVVERTGELVERAVLQRPHLGGDRGLRLRAHLWAVRREPREPVLDRPVVEARLPGPVHRGLDPPQVVRPPVVDGRRQPRRRCEALRVRVVPDPRDALRLGELPCRRRVDVLAEHVRAGRDEALGRLLLL